MRLIWAIVTMPIRNPKMPAIFITSQKEKEKKDLACSWMMPLSKRRIMGMNRMVEFMLF